MNDPRRAFAVTVVQRLRESGHVAYFAGGCVRDLLLDHQAYDYDVATDATPERVIGLFRRTKAVGLSFGVVRVLGQKDQGEVEVATFRSDGEYLDGRRPESVHFGSPEEDAARRDFTINGMFLDPLTDEVIDFVGGRRDLERRVLRAIGDPQARFTEDKLRLLRAVRFAARFRLAMDPETKRAVAAMAPEVGQVAVERITHELKRMLIHPTRSHAVELAREVGLIKAILPELLALDEPAGADRWGHTLRVLDHLPDEPSFALAMAALLLEASIGPSREISEAIALRLKLSNTDREATGWLIREFPDLHDPARLSIARRKRLLSRPGIGELLALNRAWAMASSGDLSQVEYWDWYGTEQPEGPLNPPPLLGGHDLLQNGWSPGPLFAEILEAVRDAQLEGALETRPQALEWVAHRWTKPGR